MKYGLNIGYKRETAGSRKYQHQEVAEKFMGRKLIKGEVVHHKDGNKLNNSPENLEVMTIRQHNFIHKKPKHDIDNIKEMRNLGSSWRAIAREHKSSHTYMKHLYEI